MQSILLYSHKAFPIYSTHKVHWEKWMHICDLSLLRPAAGLLTGQCLGVSSPTFQVLCLLFKLWKMRGYSWSCCISWQGRGKNEGVFMKLLNLLTRERLFPFSTKTCHVEHVHSDSTHSKSLSMKFNHYENMDSYYSYYFLLYIKPYVAG